MHPLRLLHHQLPRLLERRLLLRPRRHRQRPPLHLRLPRRSRRRTPRHPQRSRRRLALPHHLQLHRSLPPRHPSHPSHPRSQTRTHVRTLTLSANVKKIARFLENLAIFFTLGGDSAPSSARSSTSRNCTTPRTPL